MEKEKNKHFSENCRLQLAIDYATSRHANTTDSDADKTNSDADRTADRPGCRNGIAAERAPVYARLLRLGGRKQNLDENNR